MESVSINKDLLWAEGMREANIKLKQVSPTNLIEIRNLHQKKTLDVRINAVEEV